MTDQIPLEQLKQTLTNAVDWPLFVALRNRWQIQNFVETGTAGGLTAKDAACVFRQVYSVEIDREMYRQASTRCEGLANVDLSHGNSVDRLKHLLKSLKGPTLFYLDAHWCGGKRLADTECPLLEELQLIERRFCNCDRDVIVIDNAGLLYHKPPEPHVADDWPTMRDILTVVRPGGGLRPHVQLFLDQIYITPDPLWKVY